MSNWGIATAKINEVHQANYDHLKNSLLCKTWEVIDEINLQISTINWDKIGVSPERSITIKELLRSYLGKPNVASGPLYGRTKSVKNLIARYKHAALITDKLFGPEQRFEQLKLQDITEIIIEFACKPGGDFWKTRTVGNFAYIFAMLEESRRKGWTTDGISIQLPSIRHLVELLRPTIEDAGVPFDEWLEAGSWHKLTIDSALYVLNKQIEVIEDPIIAFLIEYYDFQRSSEKVPPNSIYRPGTFYESFISIARDIQESSEKYQNLKGSNDYKLASIFVRHGFINTDGSVNERFAPKMFWLTPKYVKNAALFITTAMTGIRVSELATIRYPMFELSGTVRFMSRLIKTDRGTPRNRSISKHAYAAIDAAAKLSYLPIARNDVSPFSNSHFQVFFDGSPESCKFSLQPSKESLGVRLTKIYEDTIKNNIEEAKSFPSSASPHALRHIFAAVAVRCFSDDVREFVRRHFGHADGSQFTKHYVENKLDDAIVSATESEFFKTFISEIGGDDGPFFEAVAKRIRERVSCGHIFKTPSELADVFTKEAIDACDLVGHEFGYSMPHDLSADDIDIHHLSERSKAEDITRIGITHQHLVEGVDSGVVQEASETVLTMCERMLDELGVDWEALSYE